MVINHYNFWPYGILQKQEALVAKRKTFNPDDFDISIWEKIESAPTLNTESRTPINAGDTVESWHVTSFAITDESDSGYVYLNLTNRFGIPLSEKAEDMEVIRRSSLLERMDTLELTLQNRTFGIRQTACQCLHKIALTQSYSLRERARAAHLSTRADPSHPNVRIMFDVVDLQPHVREALTDEAHTDWAFDEDAYMKIRTGGWYSA